MTSYGGVRGVANDPSSSAASGRWSVQEVFRYVAAGAWPSSDSGFGVVEPIQTITVGATAVAALDFQSIPQTYDHLFIRFVGENSSVNQGVWAAFNNDLSTSSYSCHLMYGSGTSALAQARLSDGGIDLVATPGTTNTEFMFTADILDYRSLTRHKTVRSLGGNDNNSNGYALMASGSWRSTSPVTSIRLYDYLGGGLFATGTRAVLYGVLSTDGGA